MTGLEQLRAMISGDVPAPPVCAAMGFALHEVSDGGAVFRAQPSATLINDRGTVHGGLVMTLIDSACGAAIHSTLLDGAVYVTIETKVNMVRPVTPETGPLLARGSLVHGGSTVATAEARVVGETDGRLYAHGTSTCLVRSR